MQFRTVAENLRLLIFYLTILCFSDTSNAIDKCCVLYATKMLLLQKYLLPLLIFLFYHYQYILIFFISIAIAIINVIVIIITTITVIPISIIIYLLNWHGDILNQTTICHMTSDVKFFHMFFYSIDLCSKVTTFYEL